MSEELYTLEELPVFCELQQAGWVACYDLT